jgi:transcription termination/antitermination protein NusG
MDYKNYYILKKIPDLIRILNSGDYYTKIASEEMTGIRHLLGDGDVVDCSNVYIVNSRVVVKSGPLQGFEGLIKAVDRRKLRAKITVQFMGQLKDIDVGIEILDQFSDEKIAST